MRHRVWFILVLAFLGSVGCGGQSTPDAEPQNANRPGKTADKKKAADFSGEQRKTRPKLPAPGKVIILM